MESVMRDRLLSWHSVFLFLVCLVVARIALEPLHAAGSAVGWTNSVNVTMAGDVLQKTSGCDGCEDAGATSQQEIASGDGYIEFTIGETNTLFAAGLSHDNSDTR